MKLIEYLEKNGIDYKKSKDNLTVGGSLYLEGTSISELPDNLTVGGSLYLRELPSANCQTTLPWVGISTSTRNFHQRIARQPYRGWVSLRGTYEEELPSANCQTTLPWVGLSTLKELPFYVVSDGKGKFAHGDTVKEAKEDLIYKISNRNKDEFKNLSLKSVLSFEKMIECYRVITGACGFGVREFVESNKIEQKEYTIEEVIELTKNSYGSSSFASFFNS